VAIEQPLNFKKLIPADIENSSIVPTSTKNIDFIVYSKRFIKMIEFCLVYEYETVKNVIMDFFLKYIIRNNTSQEWCILKKTKTKKLKKKINKKINNNNKKTLEIFNSQNSM
jgi:predicted transcriptional regulator